MSHELDFSGVNGLPAFARREGSEGAWHGLGQTFAEDATLDECYQAAQLFGVVKRPMTYSGPSGRLMKVEDMSAICRDDTFALLGIMHKTRYYIHQPREILEFFQKFIDANHMRMDTLGALKGGRIIFCSAAMDDKYHANIAGDVSLPYMLLFSSFDGSLATGAQLAHTRVVCNNTLTIARGESHKFRVSQKHSSALDIGGLQSVFDGAPAEFEQRARLFNMLADKSVTHGAVNEFFLELLDVKPEDLSKIDAKGKPIVSTKTRNILAGLQDSYTTAPGADIAKGTAWGMLNAVTHYVDHKANIRDTSGDGQALARVNSSTFGTGANMKARAFNMLTAKIGMLQAA